MSIGRKNVISIAGLDPSGGAGLLADAKTFEMHQVNGFGVCSALTYQNEKELDAVEWVAVDKIIRQLSVLLRVHEVDFVKIGIIENSETLSDVIDFLLSKNKNIKIIWDPILKASTGFAFSDFANSFFSLVGKIHLITPNKMEFEHLFESKSVALETSFKMNIYLKGGHNTENVGVDVLIRDGQEQSFKPNDGDFFAKHGSGCIFSAALCANLALGHPLGKSCENAKRYIENALASNQSLLSFHNQ